MWSAAEKLPPAYRDAFRLLILTGARKQEISALRWDEYKDGTITLEGERTKTGKPHIIPLSSTARGQSWPQSSAGRSSNLRLPDRVAQRHHQLGRSRR